MEPSIPFLHGLSLQAEFATHLPAIGTLSYCLHFQVVDPEDLPKRARWTIIITAGFLLLTCMLLVGITLRMAPIIDQMGEQLVPGFPLFYHLISTFELLWRIITNVDFPVAVHSQNEELMNSLNRQSMDYNGTMLMAWYYPQSSQVSCHSMVVSVVVLTWKLYTYLLHFGISDCFSLGRVGWQGRYVIYSSVRVRIVASRVNIMPKYGSAYETPAASRLASKTRQVDTASSSTHPMRCTTDADIHKCLSPTSKLKRGPSSLLIIVIERQQNSSSRRAPPFRWVKYSCRSIAVRVALPGRTQYVR